MVSRLRVYVGPTVFVLYLSALAVVISSSITGSFSRPTILLFVVFASSLVIFSIFYLVRFTPMQKQFARVTGEVELCFILASTISASYLIWKIQSTPSFDAETMQFAELFSLVITLLILFTYHFLINKRTVEDLNIKDITHEIEYLVVAGIGMFCLFGLFNFHDLVERGTFHLPSFERLVFILLIALTEEIRYRYYIQEAALEAFGRLRSVLIVSLLFTLVHFFDRPFDVHFLVITFIFGFAFGYGYIRNRNLSIPVILHVLANLFYALFF